MKIFNIDSPLMIFLTKVANLMILNFLCLMCCIPVITVGASITSMYYVTLKIIRNEDPYIFKSFFHSFKQNFRQATVIWLIYLVLGILLTIDGNIVFRGMTGNAATIMKVLFVFVSVAVAASLSYVFPVLCRFDNTVKNTIVNSFLMALMNLPRTLMIIVFNITPIALVLLNMRSLTLVTFFGFALPAYFNSKMFAKIFKRFEPEEETTDAAAADDELPTLSFIVEEEEAKRREAMEENSNAEAETVAENAVETAEAAVEETTEE